MTIEDPGEAYQHLLDRLRVSLPDIARQIEEEVARGDRIGAASMAEPDQELLQARLKGAGSRMSKEDLATIDYSDQKRLELLVDAVFRLGSSMVASRDALVRLLDEQPADRPRPGAIRLVQDADDELGVAIDPRAELARARDAILPAQAGLQDALRATR